MFLICAFSSAPSSFSSHLQLQWNPVSHTSLNGTVFPHHPLSLVQATSHHFSSRPLWTRFTMGLPPSTLPLQNPPHSHHHHCLKTQICSSPLLASNPSKVSHCLEIHTSQHHPFMFPSPAPPPNPCSLLYILLCCQSKVQTHGLSSLDHSLYFELHLLLHSLSSISRNTFTWQMFSLSRFRSNDTPPDTPSDTTLFYGILAQYTIPKLFHGSHWAEFTVYMSISSEDYEMRIFNLLRFLPHYLA